MSFKLTRDLFNSAQVVQGSGQIKAILGITVNTNGTVSDSEGGVLDILDYGNRGDHCVTKLEFTLPEALQEGYECFFIADLKEGIYLQHCSIDNLKAIAWITTDISFSETSVINTLFACVESESLQTGNIDGEIEIFVTDEFSGKVRTNFLQNGWHTGTVDDGFIMSGDDTVVDNHVPETPNPVSYTPMTWINGETELNAANMNNIMLGIEEAMRAVPENVLTSNGNDWNITGGKTFKGETYFDQSSTTRIYTTPSDSADVVNKGYVDNGDSVLSAAINAKYTKPTTGIPASDFAEEYVNTNVSEQTIITAKHFKAGNSNLANIDIMPDFTNFWKTTTFLGQTKIDINDSGTPNLLASSENTTFSKRAIFNGPLDANGLLYAGGQELRFGGDYLNVTDNTNEHNIIIQVDKDFVNFERIATFKSALNVDGLVWTGGREIRFPDYVDFKDNTEQHNIVLKIDQNYINAEKILTAKQGININVQPTEAQHAVRKDYVDNNKGTKLYLHEFSVRDDDNVITPFKIISSRSEQYTNSSLINDFNLGKIVKCYLRRQDNLCVDGIFARNSLNGDEIYTILDGVLIKVVNMIQGIDTADTVTEL